MAENDEFIREVDEEYRRDQMAQIWQRYSGLIVGVAILVVAAVGGWRYWEYSQETRAQAAATRYEEALRLARDPAKTEDAEKNLAALSKDAPTGYALLARFRLAAELGQRNAEDGAKAFEALAADGAVPANWQDLARLRAALLRIDTAAPERSGPRLIMPLAAASASLAVERGQVRLLAAASASIPVGRGRVRLLAAASAGLPVTRGRVRP